MVDLVSTGIDSRKANPVTMSKERLFVARKGKWSSAIPINLYRRQRHSLASKP
jgi:hypothetical protein